MRARTLPTVAALVAACDRATGVVPPAAHRGRIELRAATSAQVTAPFVSPVDSVRLIVRGGGGAGAVLRDRSWPFGSGDTLVVDTLVDIPQGSTRFEAHVRGNAGVELFLGDTTLPIDRDGFTVRAPVRAVNPVLVVAPPNVAINAVSETPTTGRVWIGRMVVHNRGLDSLTWALEFRSTNDPARTNPNRRAGSLRAGRMDTVQFTVRDSSLAALPITVGVTATLPASGNRPAVALGRVSVVLRR